MNKKQEVNALVRECITTALLELMQTKSFDSITITDLTKRAGVGRVSFYRNFESKEDVLRKHLQELLAAWSQWFEGQTECSFPEAILEHYYAHSELYLLLYRQGLSHISLQSVKDACGPKPEQPNALAYAAAFIAYGLYGWIEEWFKRGMQESPSEMARLFEQAQQAGNHN